MRESREAAVWLQPGSLTLEYGDEPLSAYDVELSPNTGKPKAVGGARLFETSHVLPSKPPRLFPLDEAGWLKALELEGYAPRRARGRWPYRGRFSRSWRRFSDPRQARSRVALPA